MTKFQYAQLLSACIDAARHSNRIITSVVLGSNNMIDKLHTGEMLDPQTEADVRAQHFIVSSLQRQFQGLNVVGEEDLDGLDPTWKKLLVDEPQALSCDLISKSRFPALQELDADSVLVFVDPLDGTKEYTLGHTENVTTLIGISYKGMPLAGVVASPFNGQLVAGGYGVGVFTEGGAMSKDRFLDVDTAISRNRFWSHFVDVPFIPARAAAVQIADCVALTTRSHWTPAIAAFMNNTPFKKVLQIGGCGNKALKLLLGEADVYAFPQAGTKRWDLCAVQVLLELAGGAVTTPSGQLYGYYCTQQQQSLWIQACKHAGYTDSQLMATWNEEKVFENSQGVIATANSNIQDELLSRL